jgi:hypothetical protein
MRLEACPFPGVPQRVALHADQVRPVIQGVPQVLPTLGLTARGLGQTLCLPIRHPPPLQRLGLRHARQGLPVHVRHARADLRRRHALQTLRQAVRVARTVNDAEVVPVALCQQIPPMFQRGREGLATVRAAPQRREVGFPIVIAKFWGLRHVASRWPQRS